jgi:phosphatidate cytidylyltransferase
MKKRILFGLLMIAVVAGVLYLDWWMEGALRERVETGRSAGKVTAIEPVKALPIAVVLLVLTAMGFVEVARLAAWNGVLILLVGGLIGAAMLGTLPFWWQFIESARGPGGMDVLLVLGLIVIGVFAEQMIRSRTNDALRQIACTFLAVLYLGVGGAMILGIRLSYGIPVLVLFLAAVKFTDIGAYFTGSMVGRHKIIPWLSPGKSWEGLFGGLAVAAGVSLLVVWGLRIDNIAFWEAAVFGVVVALGGQFADLCESLLKRSGNIKDSGSLVPEFGGVLDIIDSPLLGAPIAYLLLGAIA